MGLSLTLKYLKELGAGRYEYRRRVPESAKAAMGKSEFKRAFTASSPAALAREHARITAEFDKAVTLHSAKVQDPSKLTPREAAEVAREEAERLLAAGVVGAEDEDEARELLAESLIHVGASPAIYRAVVMPKEELPGHTLEDARKLYVKEKLGGGEGDEHREAMSRLDRVFLRATEALGTSIRSRPLDKLKRDDARKVRDHMLQLPKKDGGTRSPATVKRELKDLAAVINFGLKEFDIANATNPFDGLPVDGANKGGETDAEKRDPLPTSVITEVRALLKDDLLLIWRLLVGTGCRLSEVRGLRVEDVVTSGAIPFIRVTWHEGRRLKTKASVRVVPLIGDALDAAKSALKVAEGEVYLFPRFIKRRGTDNCSTQLMTRVRKVTTNRKHVVHSLRHNMKDALRLAGVSKTDQDLILGHASPSIGETYGGEEVRLQVAHRALLKVVGVGGSAKA
jgi:integrase